MYQEETTQNTIDKASLAGKVAEPTPLQRALGVNSTQLEKLDGLIVQLEDRLVSVSISHPGADGTEKNPEPEMSPVVRQLSHQSAHVMSMQDRLQRLLNSIEV